MASFIDFSSYQAMGLNALDAMACRAAVIAPETGETKEFITHDINGLVVYASKKRGLIIDDQHRLDLGRRALQDACQNPPEIAAYYILMALFLDDDNKKS